MTKTLLFELIQQIQSYNCKFGIQIAHAGRKATIRNEHIVAPSPIPFNDDLQVPLELSHEEINVIFSIS